MKAQTKQPIVARSKEYKRFTKAAAKRVARELELNSEAPLILFEVVDEATRLYERSLRMPDYQQKKGAREKLGKAIRETATIVRKHHQALHQQVNTTLLLQELGRILTYEGVEKLIGRRVGKRQLPATRPGSHEELMRADRASIASRAGPALLVSLLELMRSAINKPLVPAPKGGHPIEHPYRQWIAFSLGAELRLVLRRTADKDAHRKVRKALRGRVPTR